MSARVHPLFRHDPVIGHGVGNEFVQRLSGIAGGAAAGIASACAQNVDDGMVEPCAVDAFRHDLANFIIRAGRSDTNIFAGAVKPRQVIFEFKK